MGKRLGEMESAASTTIDWALLVCVEPWVVPAHLALSGGGKLCGREAYVARDVRMGLLDGRAVDPGYLGVLGKDGSGLALEMALR